MINVKFPKYLRSLTNNVESHNFDVETIGEIVEGLRVLFPKLSMYMSQIDSSQVSNVCYFIDLEKDQTITGNMTKKVNSNQVALVITLYGQGDDVGSILAGAALIAAGFILGPEVSLIGISGFLTGGQIALMGVSMLVGGFLSLLKPAQQQANTPTDGPVRAQNDTFGSLQNTTTTDMAVPLIFGLTRVPGQFIGGRVRTIVHNAGDFISVANYV